MDPGIDKLQTIRLTSHITCSLGAVEQMCHTVHRFVQQIQSNSFLQAILNSILAEETKAICSVQKFFSIDEVIPGVDLY